MFSSGNENGAPNRDDGERLPDWPASLPAAAGACWLTELVRMSAPEAIVEKITVIEAVDRPATRIRAWIALNAAGRKLGLPQAISITASGFGDTEAMPSAALEARFYRHIRDTIPTLAPRVLFAGWDDRAAARSLVIVEDLAAGPGWFGDEAAPLGVAQAAAVVTGLASLHASLWDSPRLDRYAWLPRSMAAGSVDADFFAGAIARLGDVAAGVRVPERTMRLCRAFVAQEARAGGPTCLLHGAASHANGFVREDGERLWVNWGHIRKGPPWRDVATFLIGALLPEDRRGAERNLIAHYRAELVARGVSNVPSFDRLWEGYCRWPLGVMLSRGDRRRADDRYRDRIDRAVEDLGTFELIEREERG